MKFGVPHRGCPAGARGAGLGGWVSCQGLGCWAQGVPEVFGVMGLGSQLVLGCPGWKGLGNVRDARLGGSWQGSE